MGQSLALPASLFGVASEASGRVSASSRREAAEAETPDAGRGKALRDVPLRQRSSLSEIRKEGGQAEVVHR